MAEEQDSAAGTGKTEATGEAAAVCECPPVAQQPVREEPDPRARLLQLAGELMRSQNRRAVIEYLRLRRAV